MYSLLIFFWCFICILLGRFALFQIGSQCGGSFIRAYFYFAFRLALLFILLRHCVTHMAYLRNFWDYRQKGRDTPEKLCLIYKNQIEEEM